MTDKRIEIQRRIQEGLDFLEQATPFLAQEKPKTRSEILTEQLEEVESRVTAFRRVAHESKREHDAIRTGLADAEVERLPELASRMLELEGILGAAKYAAYTVDQRAQLLRKEIASARPFEAGEYITLKRRAADIRAVLSDFANKNYRLRTDQQNYVDELTGELGQIRKTLREKYAWEERLSGARAESRPERR